MKTCTQCGNSYPNTRKHFPWRNKTKRTLQTECLVCQSRRKKEYRENNPEYVAREQVASLKRRLVQIPKLHACLLSFLLTNPCVDCGNTDIRVLELDHVRGNKKYNIANLIQNTYSVETLKRELKKCEARCANCHKIRTCRTQGWWKQNVESRQKN